MLRQAIMQLLRSRLWRVSCHVRRHRRSAEYPLGSSEQLEDRTLLSAVLPNLTSDLSAETESFPDGFSEETIARLQELGVQVSSNTDRESFVTLWPSDISADSQGGIVPQTDESYGIINLDTFRNDPRFAGIDGAGYSVVVIDTGIDLDHPFFGPDSDSNGIADRIVYQYDFSRWNDPNASDFDGHGSNVASIVGSSDATYPGMAPGVNIIALKVFPDNSGSATNWDIEQALQWTVNNQSQYNIVGVNMSIGSGNVQNYTNVGFSDEYSALAAMGVVTAVASGNSFYSVGSVQGVNSLSADPNVLSVGAVYDQNIGGVSYSSGATANTTDADRITPFTQRHSTLLDIFAPGAGITGANQSGGTVTYHGTSQATPHIAGITALIQQLANQYLGRMLTFDEIRDLIRSTATSINDGDDENDNVVNTNLDFLRVDMLAIAEAIWAEAAFESRDRIGVSRESQYFYLDTTSNGAWDGVGGGDVFHAFGLAGLRNIATPIVGDWDGNGDDDLGLYHQGFFYLDTTGNGAWDSVAGGDTFRDFGIGTIRSTAIPVIGDWDGNGTDDLGLYNDGFFYLDTTGNGVWDSVAGGDTFRDFGINALRATASPVVGDWDGNGTDDLGLFNDNYFYLDTSGNGVWDTVAGGDTFRNFGLGGIQSTSKPAVGDWDGDGTDDLGLFNSSYFYLDTTGNGVWDGVSGGDTFYDFNVGGNRSDSLPIVGNWPQSSGTSSASASAGSSSQTARVLETRFTAPFVPIFDHALGLWDPADSEIFRRQVFVNSGERFEWYTEPFDINAGTAGLSSEIDRLRFNWHVFPPAEAEILVDGLSNFGGYWEEFGVKLFDKLSSVVGFGQLDAITRESESTLEGSTDRDIFDLSDIVSEIRGDGSEIDPAESPDALVPTEGDEFERSRTSEKPLPVQSPSELAFESTLQDDAMLIATAHLLGGEVE